MMTIENTALNFDEWLDCLRGRLPSFDLSHNLAFAAACCERAYPNYEAFSKQEKWGDAAVLRFSLDTTWDFILTGELNERQRAALESRCKAVTPDSDDFSPKTAMASTVITAGQEAAFMVTLLLQFCRDHDPSYAVRIAAFARDTIDGYVQVIENLQASDPYLEEKIDKHPLTLAELQRQQENISKLQQIRTQDELKSFREPAVNPGRSNIGLVKAFR